MATHQRIVLALLALLIVALPLSSLHAAEDAVFKLERVSISELEGAEVSQLMRYGAITTQAASIRTTPLPNVTYPELKSKSPLYGYFSPGMSSYGGYMGGYLGTPVPQRGSKGFHFVIDEREPEGDGAAKKDPSLLNELAQALTNTRPTPRIAAKYDTLYFDANGDSDLTNDPVKGLRKEAPDGLPIVGSSNAASRIFETVKASRNGEQTAGDLYLPWLRVVGSRQPYLIFMSLAVHKGVVRIAGESFDVVLRGRYTGSSSSVLLRDQSQSGQSSRSEWRQMPLNQMHQTNGEFYTISLDPSASSLTVSPYRGKYGMFQIASRDPKIKKLGVVGTLRSKGQMSIPVGDPANQYTSEHPRQCRLPEGEYQPYYITVDYGTVQVRLSYCYYDTSGQRLSQQPCEINIREDKPFVLDFSTKPAVVFTTPAKGHVAKIGDKVVVKALIMDPELGSLVRGIYDTTQETGTRTVRNAKGESVSVPRYASLTPTVTITDSAGKEVAAGPMPFG